MTKRCDCGKIKTIQPYGSAAQIRFTCEACRQKIEEEVQKEPIHKLRKLFVR